MDISQIVAIAASLLVAIIGLITAWLNSKKK